MIHSNSSKDGIAVIATANSQARPNVSIIIPTFNSERHIRQCIESVIRQDLREIEVICVDDGSADSTLDILSGYASRDSRITIVKQAKASAGAARNVGLQFAQGEYIGFVDSDDFAETSMFGRMLKTAQQTNADIVICRCKSLNMKTGLCSETELDWALDTTSIPTTVFSVRDIPDKAFQLTSGFPWNKIYRRSMIECNQIRFQDLTNTNDAFFVFSALLHAKRIAYVDDRLITKRHDYADSLTNNRAKDPACFVHVIDKLQGDMAKQSVPDAIWNSFWRWAYGLAYRQLTTLPPDARRNLYPVLHSHMQAWEEGLIYNKDVLKAMNICRTHAEYPLVRVAFSTNRKFLELCKVSIVSVLESRIFEDVEIIILHSELRDEDISGLRDLSKRLGFQLRVFAIDSARFASFPRTQWCSIETWYRCLLPELLPDVERILYLDCDTIVRQSLLPLWDIDISGKLFGVVEDSSRSKSRATELGLADKFYFNAGVVLMNLVKCRELDLVKCVFDFLARQNYDADQGALNKVSDGLKLRLPPQYNYINVWWRENDCQYDDDYLAIYRKCDPVIVHFTGMKPTNEKCGNPYKKEFDKFHERLQMFEKLTEIPIVMAFDRCIADHVPTTVRSIIGTMSKWDSLSFFFFVSRDLSQRQRENLLAITEECTHCTMRFIETDAFKNAVLPTKHITTPAYYRLLIADFLPQTCKRAIYLDVDVCVCGSLAGLLRVDLRGCYAAGVPAAVYHLQMRDHRVRLGLPDLNLYVNSGVLVFNLEMMRNDGMTRRLVSLVDANYQGMDQDIINVAFAGRIKRLEFKYNLQTKYMITLSRFKDYVYGVYPQTEITEALEHPLIIHYADKVKPWGNAAKCLLAERWLHWRSPTGAKAGIGEISIRRRNDLVVLNVCRRFLKLGYVIALSLKNEGLIRSLLLFLFWMDRVLLGWLYKALELLMRKSLGGVQCLEENGMKYTILHGFQKFKSLF